MAAIFVGTEFSCCAKGWGGGGVPPHCVTTRRPAIPHAVGEGFNFVWGFCHTAFGLHLTISATLFTLVRSQE